MKGPKFRKLLFIFTGVIVAVSFFIVYGLAYFGYMPNKPNIVFITVDALRADHLGCYGYKRRTSPNIDRLANDGAYFLNSFSTSCSTIHATPALISGQYLAISNLDILFDDYLNIFDKKFTTLTEYLKRFGYYTAAFLNNAHFRIGTGFEQGFDIYRIQDDNAGIATNKAIDFLNSYTGNKPLFIWIHYIDTHTPYSAPEEYFKIFENDRFYKDNDKILQLNPSNSSPYESKGYIPQITFRKDKFSLNYYIALYDAEILYTDFHIGRLLKNIKANTLIILTADHGESLGEHNIYFHHENMHDEILQIPLIIKDNRYFKGGKKISTVVSSIDIVPTILNKVNPLWYSLNRNRFDGIDLKRLVKSAVTERKYIYAYFPGIWSVRDVNENIKYFLFKDKKEAVYLIPDENNNFIYDNSPDFSVKKDKLKKALEIWLKSLPLYVDINPHKAHLDENIRQNLRSLGYIQ